MITLHNLILQRGTRRLLDGAQLTLHPGQHVGLVGRNGAGKTSLMALLAGELAPDGGDARRPGDWRVAWMRQEPAASERPAIEFVLDGDEALRAVERQLEEADAAADHNRLALLHDAFDRLDGYSARARASELLHGLGFTAEQVERPVNSFSGGWRMRLALAQTLMKPSELMLLDEPTNHLDLDTLWWLEGWLKRYPGTLVVISHDRDSLDGVASHIVHLADGQLTLYRGNYSSFEEQRAARLVQQQAQFEQQQRRRDELQRFVDRFRAKATKARQAQSRLKALERMEALAPAHWDSPFQFEFRPAERLSDPLLNLSGAAVGYGEKRVLNKVSLSLRPGDRVGLLGANGAGKSTLIKSLVGALPLLGGERVTGEHTAIGYFAQHQIDALDLDASPLLHLQRLSPQASEQQLRDFIGGFDFRGDDALQAVGRCSGGEKARLALALLAWQRPNLLLLDEPTNHLDLDMRHALSEALQAFAGAVVVVSHDRFLLKSTCDQFWLVADGAVGPFDGELEDYHQWLSSRESPAASAESSAPRADRKAERRAAAEVRQQLAPLKKQLQAVEKRIAEHEQRLAVIEAQLADTALYDAARKADLQRLLREQGELRQKHGVEEGRWFELQEALEDLEKSLG